MINGVFRLIKLTFIIDVTVVVVDFVGWGLLLSTDAESSDMG